MKTKKAIVAEPAVHTDSATSPESSPRDRANQETDASWLRLEKLLETAGPAEILEKPVLLRDGRWLTAEEVAEYAKALEKSA